MLRDRFNRRINYLRLSITDRCNLRCRYCTTDGKLSLVPHNELLSYRDLLRISRTAVKCGIEKIRITGGEPLVRKGVIDFLTELNRIEGLRELVLTTNGVNLDRYARDLKDAGLKRINVSLDSLNSVVFKAITGGGALADVLRSISVAENVGFPLKINMVVMRDINDSEIEDFVHLTLMKNISVRFIEYMPIGNDQNWHKFVVSSVEIMQRLKDRFDFTPLLSGPLSGPAVNYQIDGAQGTFGVISPVSGHFCQSCNRIRVTSVGKARSCLFSNDEVDLKSVLEQNDDALLEQKIKKLVINKQINHQMNFGATSVAPFQMSTVGG